MPTLPSLYKELNSEALLTEEGLPEGGHVVQVDLLEAVYVAVELAELYLEQLHPVNPLERLLTRVGEPFSTNHALGK